MCKCYQSYRHMADSSVSPVGDWFHPHDVLKKHSTAAIKYRQHFATVEFNV
jgi:hypothetical protein